ncbi:Hypothetical predicted protein [Lecanosticta acicola]|uniref:Uncharacterized protein n=1 Tax=Lecanosticta acicola TaxID=111012 RepID=A0AAI9EDF7_9PEZI|nr:Hypothetical predicted protein [Lecanosticta acicola]
MTQTRLYIQRLIAGIEDDDDDVKWPEDLAHHPKKSGEGSGRKGKERASLGGSVADAWEGSRSKGKERRSLGANGDSSEPSRQQMQGDDGK